MPTYYSNYNNEYRLKLVITLHDQTDYYTEINASFIEWDLYLEQGWKKFNGLVQEGYLNINGVRQWTAPSSYDSSVYPFNSTIGFGGGTLEVTHNTDGTKSLPILAKFSANSGGFGPVGLLIDVSYTLPSIGGKAKVFTGGSWQARPAKIWTGSAWVAKPVKIWNGSAWVVSKP